MKWQYILLGSIVIGAFFWALAQNQPSSVPTSSEITQEQLYKNTFIEGCLSEAAGQRTYCECVWNDLRVTYTLSQISDISTRYNSTGLLPQQMQKSINNCLGSVN